MTPTATPNCSAIHTAPSLSLGSLISPPKKRFSRRCFAMQTMELLATWLGGS
uniref:U11/U12 small nuclear ribonucleoprotein 35 kDa protein-like n=1 Tax=Rhizophora mucronata TaxID=61149 RepID=A0A2P2LAG3_RHIMU